MGAAIVGQSDARSNVRHHTTEHCQAQGGINCVIRALTCCSAWVGGSGMRGQGEACRSANQYPLRGRMTMPEKRTIEKARKDKRAGKAPSTQAGEFVREEVRKIRRGEHGA